MLKTAIFTLFSIEYKIISFSYVILHKHQIEFIHIVWDSEPYKAYIW